jgi:anaphase-promoting complex subunit 4
MRLLAHHVLLFCSQETEQFSTFSRWLRREIDVQAAQSPPNPNEEAEQDLGLDYALLFSYIQGPLQQSKLDLFVKWERDTAVVDASASMYEDMKRALDSFKAGDSVSEELINLGVYFEDWVSRNSTLVGEITSHQRASSTITTGFVLEEGDVLLSDLWMAQPTDGDNALIEPEGVHLITTTSAVVHKDKANQGEFFSAMQALPAKESTSQPRACHP